MNPDGVGVVTEDFTGDGRKDIVLTHLDRPVLLRGLP
jgi:hypothetical protein